MKPFSLDAVLKYRKRLMDIARNKFAQAQNQYNSVKLLLEQQRANQSQLIQTLVELQLQGIEIQEHIRYENRIELLKSEIKKLEDQLRKKQDLVIRERNNLLKKSKEHRVMEKLRERQDAAWRQYLDKKEAAMLDEIAVLYKDR